MLRCLPYADLLSAPRVAHIMLCNASGALEKVARLPGGAEAVNTVLASSRSDAAQQTFPVRLV